jgi:hypothetical protein
MPGTVRLVDRDKLLFCFPYDPVTNDELRDAADNRVRWDARRRGFTLSVTSLRYNPSLAVQIGQFIIRRGLDADTDVRKLLAFRHVKETSSGAPGHLSHRAPGPHVLGPGMLRAGLLPSATWGSNLRGVFSREDWDRLRIPVCTAAGDRCEVCGAQVFTDSGRPRRPDCHELWTFEHKNGRNIQRLDVLIALCRDCHRVQHVGLAGVQGETDAVIAKLQAVNGWTQPQAQQEVARAWTEYERLERYSWDLDLSALGSLITIDGYPDLYIPASDRVRLGNSYYG